MELFQELDVEEMLRRLRNSWFLTGLSLIILTLLVTNTGFSQNGNKEHSSSLSRQEDWITFLSDSGSFTVELPDTPRKRTKFAISSEKLEAVKELIYFRCAKRVSYYNLPSDISPRSDRFSAVEIDVSGCERTERDFEKEVSGLFLALLGDYYTILIVDRRIEVNGLSGRELIFNRRGLKDRRGSGARSRFLAVNAGERILLLYYYNYNSMWRRAEEELISKRLAEEKRIFRTFKPIFKPNDKQPSERRRQKEWSTFSSDSGSFTVELPDIPRKINKLAFSKGEGEIVFFKCARTLSKYNLPSSSNIEASRIAITEIDVSGCERTESDFEKKVSELFLALLDDYYTALVVDKTVKVNGLSGRELVYKLGAENKPDAETYRRVRAINAGERIFLMYYDIYSRTEGSFAEEERIFRTFKPNGKQSSEGRKKEKEWVAFSSDSGSFTVELPDTPQKIIKLAPSGREEDFRFDFYIFRCTKKVSHYRLPSRIKPMSNEPYRFLIVETDVSRCKRTESDFDREVNRFFLLMLNDKFVALSDKKVKVNGLSGREIIYKKGSGVDKYSKALAVNAGERILFLLYDRMSLSRAEEERIAGTFKPKFKQSDKQLFEQRREGDWTTFSPDSGSFTVELPDTPRKITKLAPLKRGEENDDELKVFEYAKSLSHYYLPSSSNIESSRIKITEINLSEHGLTDIFFDRKVSELFLDELVIYSKVLSDKRVKVNGLNGRELIYKLGSETYNRILAVNAGESIFLLRYYSYDRMTEDKVVEEERVFRTFKPVFKSSNKQVFEIEEEEWITFSSDSGSFTVELPYIPRKIVKFAVSNEELETVRELIDFRCAKKVSYYNLQAYAKTIITNNRLSIVEIDVSGCELTESDFERDVNESFMSNLTELPLSDKKVKVNGLNGREITYKRGLKVYNRSLAVNAGGRIFLLHYYRMEGSLAEEERIFKTFRLKYLKRELKILE